VRTVVPDALSNVNVAEAADVPGLTTANPVDAKSAGVNARGKFNVV
jgi:hypothetical protein